MPFTLDKFTRAYLIAALWSSTGDDGEPLDTNYDLDDLSPSFLARAIDDCRVFQGTYADLLGQVPHGNREGSAEEQNGHDFWLTRNHHGAGFWDRGYGEVGDALTEAAQAYGEIELYIGDDGQIYGA